MWCLQFPTEVALLIFYSILFNIALQAARSLMDTRSIMPMRWQKLCEGGLSGWGSTMTTMVLP